MPVVLFELRLFRCQFQDMNIIMSITVSIHIVSEFWFLNKNLAVEKEKQLNPYHDIELKVKQCSLHPDAATAGPERLIAALKKVRIFICNMFEGFFFDDTFKQYFDIIYDRAALIAMNVEDREQYGQLVRNVIKPVEGGGVGGGGVYLLVGEKAAQII